MSADVYQDELHDRLHEELPDESSMLLDELESIWKKLAVLEEANRHPNAPEVVEPPNPKEPWWWKAFKEERGWEWDGREIDQGYARIINAILAAHKPKPVKLYVWHNGGGWQAGKQDIALQGLWNDRTDAIVYAIQRDDVIEIVEGRPPEGE